MSERERIRAAVLARLTEECPPGSGPSSRSVLCDELGLLRCSYTSAHGWEAWWEVGREDWRESAVMTLEEVTG